MLVRRGRARQATGGRADRARRAAQGARAARAAPTLHQLLQPRLPARLGSHRDPGEGPGVAAGEAARGAGRPDLGRRRGPPARAPRGDPGARDREPAEGNRRQRRWTSSAGSPAPLSSASPSTTAGRTALEPASSGVDGAVATLLGILHEAQLAGHWSRMKALPPVRVRVLRPLEEPIGGLVRHVDLRQPDEEPRVLPAPPHDGMRTARRRRARLRRHPAALPRPRAAPRWRTWSWRRPT